MYDINPWRFFFSPGLRDVLLRRDTVMYSHCCGVQPRMISPIFVLSSRVRIDPGKRKFVIIITFCLFFFLEKPSEMIFFQNRWSVRMYANESGRAAARVYLRMACIVCVCVCVYANRKPAAARVFAY